MGIPNSVRMYVQYICPSELSRVRGSVTNNGFWIGFIDASQAVTTSHYTSIADLHTTNYKSCKSIFTGLYLVTALHNGYSSAVCSLDVSWWRILATEIFYFRCPLLNTPHLNTQLIIIIILLFLVVWDWVHLVLRPLLACCTSPYDRWWWLWSNWWTEDWWAKPNYSRKTCTSPSLSTTKPTWPNPGSNPGRRGGKPATNRLSYGAVLTLNSTQLLNSLKWSHVSSLHNFGKDRVEVTTSNSSSIIACLFVSVGSAATVWFPQVYTFSFPHPWTRTPSNGLCPRIVSPWQNVCLFAS
jgi:hypothetical protein